MIAPPSLYCVTCRDARKDIGISGYSDIVVYDQNHKLAAIRIGGYPETVQAMIAAISVGCNLEVKVSNQEKLELISLHSQNCIRSISHDGTYAEGFFYLTDDNILSISMDDENHSEKEAIAPNRNLYVYYEGHEEDRLFRELDQKLSVPLLPEFKGYFLDELKRKGILNPLHVLSLNRSFSAWHLTVTQEEKELVEILEHGLRNRTIQILGGKTEDFKNIYTFTSYLQTFGKQIAKRIGKSFLPLYHPDKEPISSSLQKVNRFVMDRAGYSLLDAQLIAAEGLKRQLDRDRLALLVAECGTGKSKIGAAAVYAYWKDKGKTKSLHVVICPSHLTQKWVREIGETIPDSIAAVVSSLSDVDRLFDVYQRKEKHVFLILSKEDARNGPMRYPAVRWSTAKKGYLCPHCGCIQEMPLVEDTSYTVPADALFFRRENRKNHACQACGMPLWSSLNPDIQQKLEWVHIGGYGFVSRRFASRNFASCKDKSISREIEKIVENPSAAYPSKGAYRRFPLSAYIKRRLGRIDTLICDELHQYAGESAQGQSMAELAGIADKVLGMTATLVNGYSKGIFYLLFRLKPALMLADRQRFHKPTDFKTKTHSFPKGI
nr:DEAD/DEAH box helicase family protein [uncultured Solibaculum sp.]